MEVLLNSENLHKIVSKAYGISVIRPGLYSCNGKDYKIYLDSPHTIVIECDKSGLGDVPVYIRSVSGDISSMGTTISNIIFSWFSRAGSLDLAVSPKMRDLSKFIAQTANSCYSGVRQFEFISVNAETGRSTLYSGYSLRFLSMRPVVILSTTYYHDESHLLPPKTRLSIGQFNSDAGKCSIESYLSTGCGLLNEEIIDSSSSVEDAVARWMIHQGGMKALSKLPKRWIDSDRSIGIIDRFRLPSIPGMKFTRYLRRDYSYTLLEFKLDNDSTGLLEIEDNTYTIICNDWEYKLPKESLKTFYKTYIIPGCELVQKMKSLEISLQPSEIDVLSRCIDGSEGILKVVLNLGYGICPTITFLIDSDFSISIYVEIGNTKTELTRYVSVTDTVSDLVLQVLEAEKIINEDIIKKLKK